MSSKIKAILDRLETKIENIQSSEEYKEILETYSQFHDYSYRNTLLIMMQMPEATRVAGYNQWQELGRQVQKGEEGITILAPMTYTTTETEIIEEEVDGEIVEREVEKEVKKIYFRAVHVFDISQTKGKPLPEFDLSLSDNRSFLLPGLEDFARKENIDVKCRPLPQGKEGISRSNAVILDSENNATEKASVLMHELAHILLHHREDRDKSHPREVRELEAESVAFVVMDHFDLEIKSARYLSLYKKSHDLRDSLSAIKSASKVLISHCREWIEDNISSVEATS